MEIKSILPLFCHHSCCMCRITLGGGEGFWLLNSKLLFWSWITCGRPCPLTTPVGCVGRIYWLLYPQLKINPPVQGSAALACIQTWRFTSVDGFFAFLSACSTLISCCSCPCRWIAESSPGTFCFWNLLAVCAWGCLWCLPRSSWNYSSSGQGAADGFVCLLFLQVKQKPAQAVKKAFFLVCRSLMQTSGCVVRGNRSHQSRGGDVGWESSAELGT